MTGSHSGTNIISLDAARAARQVPVLRVIEDYWEGLRGPGLVPARRDVDPTGLETGLAHTFVVERIAPGLGRVRVAGSHLCDLLGMEVRGMPVSALFDPVSRHHLSESLGTVFSNPAVVQMALSCPGSIGRPTLRGGMVLLPMRGDDGEITLALGAVAMGDKLGRPPRRPVIECQTRRMLTARADADVGRLP